MIPLQLTLQGIYSYQEKQTIDFTALTEANIFGIFGAVGSGKSTILEAITYALYGRTDRLNLAGDNRNYNMMNLKSDTLLIEFIFSTGQQNTEYLATVKSRRNSKQFDDVKTPERAAYVKQNNVWMPVAMEALENAIGLSYENFKRTIIIPQGKFQEFLQLGNKERTQMMKELFGLEKFELFYSVVALDDRNNEQLKKLEGQLQQLGETDAEKVPDTQQRIALIKTEIAQKSAELDSLRAHDIVLSKIKELTEKLAVAENTLLSLQREEPQYVILEKNTKEFAHCSFTFKSLFDAKNACDTRIQQFEQALETDTQVLESVALKLIYTEQQFVAVKAAYDAKDQLRTEADALAKISGLHKLRQHTLALAERIAKGEKMYAETAEKANQQKAAINLLTDAIKEHKSQYPDMARLAKANEWFALNNTLLAREREMTKEAATLTAEMYEVETRTRQLLPSEHSDALPAQAIFKALFTVLDASNIDIRAGLAQLQHALEHLAIQQKLNEYASNLDEGSPCPLCGSLTHPQPLDAKNISEQLTNQQANKTNLEKQISDNMLIHKQIADLETTYMLKHEQLEKHVNLQREHVLKTALHKSLYVWPEMQDENALRQAFDLATQLQQTIGHEEQQLEKLTVAYDALNLDKDKYYSGLETIKHQFTASTAEYGSLEKQIDDTLLSEYLHKSPEDIESRSNELLWKQKETETLYETLTQQLLALQKEHSTTGGRVEANKKGRQHEHETLKHAMGTIDALLLQWGYSSMAEVEKILSQPIDIERENKKIMAFKQALNVATEQQTTLKSELGTNVHDQAKHAQIRVLIGVLNDDITAKNQHQGRLENEYKKLVADIETRKTLVAQQHQLQLRADGLKTLRNLFKASGFVNYISSVYLHELSHAANERFYKLTRQKLRLEVNDDNNFEVRDFMNGGKLRSVKTLSGGQTFQAALSLALALADNIQHSNTSHQNFFFLDEGFGSLDKEALDIVFETLKTLRKENRIVGVISHVDDMQQEIDVHLKVTNDDEKGSIIQFN